MCIHRAARCSDLVGEKPYAGSFIGSHGTLEFLRILARTRHERLTQSPHKQSGLDAVHPGHLQVHEYESEFLPGTGIHGGRPILDDDHIAADRLQEALGILVVDDNETNRRVLLTQLSHAGYEVTLASGGKEALATMRSATAAARHFDVALVDFQMPDMDGAMLGEQINAGPYLSRTRVVLLTSMDRHGDMGRFAAMGFAGYLSKPVRPRELLVTLEQVLSHDAQEWHAQTHPISTLNVAQQSALAKRFSGRVLLVEDNIVNQKVARRFLENSALAAATSQLEECLTRMGAELARVGAALRHGATHALPAGFTDAARPAS
jgi:CheY-like chemotaxis protein